MVEICEIFTWFWVEPVVYIPENPTYPIVDENLIKEVSDKVIVLKHKIFWAYSIGFSSQNKKKWIRGLFQIKKTVFADKTFLWIREIYLFLMLDFLGDAICCISRKYILIMIVVTSVHHIVYILLEE
jgi:hypothetical protein